MKLSLLSKSALSSRAFLLALAGLGTAFSFSSVASAKEGEAFEAKGGVYVNIEGGISLPTDANYTGTQQPAAGVPGTPGAPANVDVGFENGAFIRGAVGYRIPTRVLGLFQPSVELEVNYTEFDVSGGSFNGGNQTFSGDQEALTFSANYLSEIRWSNDQKVIPFWGGGIGIARVENNIGYFPNNGVANAPTFALQGDETGLSLQSNVGVSFVLTENIELTTQARYQRITGLDFDRRFIANGSNGLNASVSDRYENVILSAGLKYRF